MLLKSLFLKVTYKDNILYFILNKTKSMYPLNKY